MRVTQAGVIQGSESRSEFDSIRARASHSMCVLGLLRLSDLISESILVNGDRGQTGFRATG